MDPYLEAHWLDVHGALVIGARDVLNQRLPDDLVARSEERPAIDAGDWDAAHGMRPDVRVFPPGEQGGGGGSLAIASPFVLTVDPDPPVERFIRILRPDDQRLITFIEFLSPTNKTGRGMTRYRQNRGELLEAGVHVVEIDLVRQGDWRALLLPHDAPADAISTWRAIVRLGGDPSRAHYFPLHIDQPLPEIPIPLRPEDPSIHLPLQDLVDRAYQAGRYARTIDYSRPCIPPLAGQEAKLAERFLLPRARSGQV